MGETTPAFLTFARGLAWELGAPENRAGITAEAADLFYESAKIEQYFSLLTHIDGWRRAKGFALGDFNPEKHKISPSTMLKGTVSILVNKGIRIEKGVGYPDRDIGSGFFIDKRGYVLTNYHVVQSEVNPEYEGFSRLYIRLPESENERIPAQVVGWDSVLDLALLKTQVEPDYVFPILSKSYCQPGDRIFAIGSPGGLSSTVTSGIVSASGRRFLQIGSSLQVDVPINPGNSGGPLLNEDGSLIGVVFAGIEPV